MRKVIVLIAVTLIQYFVTAQKSDYLFQIGKVDSLYSKALKENRDFYVQLPENYDQNPHKNYPVLYVLDGDVLLPTVYAIHRDYYGGFMPEMIIVGVSNVKNRFRDLTISKVKKLFGRTIKRKSGGADDFLSFLERDLIPHVENKYRVSTYRTLIGHSHGGLFTIYTLLNAPHLFENYISIDPSLYWDNQKLLTEAEIAFSKKNFTGKSLHFSLSGQLHNQDPNVTIGNVMEDTSEFTEFSRSNIQFRQLLEETAHNINYKWQFYPNDLHGTITNSAIKDGLLSLFIWYQMESTDKINNPETTIDELEKVIQYREEKLFKHFGYKVPPYPEDLLNMSGYMNLDMGLIEKSKMYFEKAIKYYPQSANVYDSMADFYIRQNNFKEAKLFLRKAFEISGNDTYQTKIKMLQE